MSVRSDEEMLAMVYERARRLRRKRAGLIALATIAAVTGVAVTAATVVDDNQGIVAGPPATSAPPSPPLSVPSSAPTADPFIVTLVPGDEAGFGTTFAPGQPVEGPAGLVVSGTQLGPADGIADRPLVWWSADGRVWEPVGLEAFRGSAVGPVAATDGRYLVAAQSMESATAPGQLYSSLDGRNWELAAEVHGGMSEIGPLIGVGQLFFRSSPEGVLTSTDGAIWVPASFGSPEINLLTSAIAWTGDAYLLLQSDEASKLAAIWRSSDGIVWDRLPGDFPPVTIAGLAGADGAAMIAFRDPPSRAEGCDRGRTAVTTVAPSRCNFPVHIAPIDPVSGHFDPSAPVVFTTQDTWTWLTASNGGWIATQRNAESATAWTSFDGEGWLAAEPPVPVPDSWRGGISAAGQGAIMLLDDQSDDSATQVALVVPSATASDG